MRIEKEGLESILEEIMVENYPNFRKETDIQIQETPKLSIKTDLERVISRHVIIKLSKVKERIFKMVKEKPLVTYKSKSLSLRVNFFSRNCISVRSGVIFLKYSGEKLSTKSTLPSKVVLKNRFVDKR